MKLIRSLIAVFSLTIFLVVSASAQVNNAKPLGENKIALINTFAFGDVKSGITKYTNAVKSLNNEFKPVQTELEAMEIKLQSLSKEVQILKDNAAKNIPVSQATINSKIEEGEKLQREYKFKQEDVRARIESREQGVMTPILEDIYKAAQEFSKQKGFMLVLDIAKMSQSGIALAWDDRADITKDFIAFYNARPSGTTSP